MVIRFLYVVRHHVLKRQHAIDIQIAGTGDQVLFICVFRSKLIADQMASVIEIFTVDAVILDRVPARGLLLMCDKEVIEV